MFPRTTALLLKSQFLLPNSRCQLFFLRHFEITSLIDDAIINKINMENYRRGERINKNIAHQMAHNFFALNLSWNWISLSLWHPIYFNWMTLIRSSMKNTLFFSQQAEFNSIAFIFWIYILIAAHKSPSVKRSGRESPNLFWSEWSFDGTY